MSEGWPGRFGGIGWFLTLDPTSKGVRMKIYKGKWYFAVRFKNDLCLGLGRAPQWMKNEAVRSRRHAGV